MNGDPISDLIRVPICEPIRSPIRDPICGLICVWLLMPSDRPLSVYFLCH